MHGGSVFQAIQRKIIELCFPIKQWSPHYSKGLIRYFNFCINIYEENISYHCKHIIFEIRVNLPKLLPMGESCEDFFVAVPTLFEFNRISFSFRSCFDIPSI